MAGPFDDELSPEEEALLKDSTLPPAEEEGEGSVEEAVAEAAAQPAAEPKAEPAAEAPKEGEPKPAAEPAAPEVDADEKSLQEFLDKHKDKTPEELARLAFQQSKRANREAATNRQTRDSVSALAERARTAAARRDQLATSVPELVEKFKAKLAEDPDAATAEMFQALLNREVSEADAEARAARVDEAIVFADTHIPEFGKQWDGMKSLANEIGYTDEEINAIDDGRPLIILSLANHTARLMKAGVMDRFGNLVNMPQLEAQPLDPRLSAPTPQRTLGGGARSTGGSHTLEQQLNALAEMSDADLARFERENPGAIDNLLKQAV